MAETILSAITALQQLRDENNQLKAQLARKEQELACKEQELQRAHAQANEHYKKMLEVLMDLSYIKGLLPQPDKPRRQRK